MWTESFSRIVTLIVTNTIKVAGLLIGIHAIATGPSPNAVVLAYSAFMMAGAQVSERAVLVFIRRFFGMGDERDEK